MQEPLGQVSARVPSDEVVEAVLRASRALVAIAARSLAAAGEDVTLPQYRALVVLAGRGTQRVQDLAEALGVNASTATRMADRLARKGLVRRHRPPSNRRTVQVTLTAAGRDLVDAVTASRRTEIGRVLRRVPAAERPALIAALSGLADAAGEPEESDLLAGWSL